ncbi:phospholipid phosphatase 1-like [Asterias amurensis]|uniref:phospholipid phosphatase 1-like n=1 Tax=Asterias amurensis TaxID=7602 RepID=UPI003AB77369
MARITNGVLWKSLSNLVILIFCVLPGGLLELIATPTTSFQRGFYCNDASIRYPYKDSTFSTLLSFILCLGIPLLFMLIIEFLLYNRFDCLGEPQRDVPSHRGVKILCLKVHSYLAALFAGYTPFLFAGGMTLSMTNVLKYMVGRLRPHFLSVCQPDFAMIQCKDSNGYYIYVEDFQCSAEANISTLLDARLSFPSGHAASAASSFIYLAIYLQFRMVWNSPYLLKPFIQSLLVAFAMIISASRVSDFKHFFSDVVCGFFLGTAIAVFVAFFVSDLYYFESPSNLKEKASTDFVGSRTDTDLSTIVSIPSNYKSTEPSDGRKPTNI